MRHPPGFHVTNIPKGNLVLYTTHKIDFFRTTILFSFFFALSAAGYAGGPPVHDGASVGPGRAPWRVLWAFRVRNLASNNGVVFRGAGDKRDNGKPTFQFFMYVLAPLPYSHAATVRHSLQTFPVVTATDTIYTCVLLCVCDACACVCECARDCACVCWDMEEFPLLRLFCVGIDTQMQAPFDIHIYT